MFYEEEIVNKIFKCQHCNQQYDEPRLLSCGKTICTNCLHKMENNLLNKNKNELNCLMCHKMHQIPSEGFPLNEILLSLMQEKPKEVFRSEQVESLKQNLTIAKEKLDSFTFDLNNSEFKVKEHCLELRRLVQLSTENKISEINRLNQDLIDQIDDYETKCLKSTTIEQKQTFDKLISEISKFHIDKSVYLKGYQINDQEVKAINKQTTEMNKKLDYEAHNLNKTIFNYNKMKFEMNQNILDQELLGSFSFECLLKSTDLDFLSQINSLNLVNIYFVEFEILDENRIVFVYLDNTDQYNIIVYDINEKTYKKSQQIYRGFPQLLINKSLKKIAISGDVMNVIVKLPSFGNLTTHQPFNRTNYIQHQQTNRLERQLEILDENLERIVCKSRLERNYHLSGSDETNLFVWDYEMRKLDWNLENVESYFLGNFPQSSSQLFGRINDTLICLDNFCLYLIRDDWEPISIETTAKQFQIERNTSLVVLLEEKKSKILYYDLNGKLVKEIDLKLDNSHTDYIFKIDSNGAILLLDKLNQTFKSLI